MRPCFAFTRVGPFVRWIRGMALPTTSLSRRRRCFGLVTFSLSLGARLIATGLGFGRRYHPIFAKGILVLPFAVLVSEAEGGAVSSRSSVGGRRAGT
jgi:hypothetical protein